MSALDVAGIIGLLIASLQILVSLLAALMSWPSAVRRTLVSADAWWLVVCSATAVACRVVGGSSVGLWSALLGALAAAAALMTVGSVRPSGPASDSADTDW
ncbi:hypothetical protein [Nocardioides litoris]|uniref:hypothetical protein n=1 Tax=Nocardioides litoris TaxID=1926648 RepID=UPI00111CA6D4|nr:hypothetical protein [Nocardioides litoris]